MKLLRNFTLTVLLLILTAACVAPGESSSNRLPTDAEVEQYNASVDPSKRIMCRDERRVRSRIPVRVCRRVADLEALSLEHRRELRRALGL